MHSAAILAGGRASRFDGRDKGALVVDGRTIRDRQLAVLSRVADDVLTVGGPDSDVPDLVPDSGPTPRRGPFRGEDTIDVLTELCD